MIPHVHTFVALNKHLYWYIQAKKIMEHNRKYERKREEKEIKARKERMRKAKEEYERAKEVRYTEDQS